MDNEFNKFGEWEEGWKQAFEDSHQTPPGRVWQGLENSLMEQQLKYYRRKLVVYQGLAAASVLLLCLWAGWWLFFAQPQVNKLVDDTPDAATTSAPADNGTAAEGAGKASNATEILEEEEFIHHPGAVAGREADPQLRVTHSQSVSSSATVAPAATQANKRQNRLSTATSVRAAQADRASLVQNVSVVEKRVLYAAKLQAMEENLNALILKGQTDEIEYSVSQYDPSIAALSADLELQEGMINDEIPQVIISRKTKKKKNIHPNGSTWIGASFGSTFFDPNIGVSASNSLAWTEKPVSSKGGQVYSASASNWDEKEASVPSVNFSLNAAFRLGERWMVRSGLGYGTFKVGNMTGTFTDQNSNEVYPLYYTNFSYDKLQKVSQNSRKAAPVDAFTTYSFVSVPLMFNYVVFERNIGLSLGTGMSTDIFVGGRIIDQERQLEKYDISAGPDSPFNKFHFNALLGAQLFYRAGPNHLFTVEPTYKYSLTNFNKKTSYFDSRPRQLGVAVGFRYILR